MKVLNAIYKIKVLCICLSIIRDTFKKSYFLKTPTLFELRHVIILHNSGTMALAERGLGTSQWTLLQGKRKEV